MPSIEELTPGTGPVATRPPDDEIEDDEDEEVCSYEPLSYNGFLSYTTTTAFCRIETDVSVWPGTVLLIP